MQHMVFFSCQTICSTPWGARSFQNRQLGALLTAKLAGPPHPGRRRVADRACAGFVNDEAARLGLDEPKSLAKRLGTQLPGARGTQARKHGLMTCSITIRCGKPPPRWHCASLRGGGWGQWYYQSVRVWQVRSVWGTWRREETGRMGKVGGKKTRTSASVKTAKSTEREPTVSSEQVVGHQIDFRECALFFLSAWCSVPLAIFWARFTPKASSRVRTFNGVQHVSLPVRVVF